MKNELESKAVEALKSALRQVSAIKLEDIRIESPDPHRPREILARVDVLGHMHLLVCKVNSNCQPQRLESALSELGEFVRGQKGNLTPVLIAPVLSPEAQALCMQHHAGYIDLEGNARIEMNDVFIAKRSYQQRSPVLPTTQTTPKSPIGNAGAA